MYRDETLDLCLSKLKGHCDEIFQNNVKSQKMCFDQW